MAKSLIKKADTGVSAVDELRRKVQAIFAAHALRTAQDVQSMDKYADYSADELKELSEAPIEMLREKGLSRRAIRIALYSLLPKKEVPFGVLATHERYLVHARRNDEAEGLVRLGFEIGRLPPRAPRRDDSEVINVEATEVK